MARRTSADVGEHFALEAMRHATMGMEASDQWVNVATASGTQMGFALSPKQFNDAYNIYVNQ